MTFFDLKTQVEKHTKGECSFSGDEWRVNCPGSNCIGYTDLKFYFNIEKEKGHCFRCGKTVHSLKDFFKYIIIIDSKLDRDWYKRTSINSDGRELVIKTYKALHSNKITATVPVDFQCAPLPDDAFRILGCQGTIISMEIINYLRDRGFNDQAINLIDPYFANHLSYGIILPYKRNGEIVFWIQRLFGSYGPKYISAINEGNSGLVQYYGKSSVLWNIDNIEDNSQVVICEGIFSAASVIQCGLQAIGISGKTLSEMQRSLLMEKKPKKILIALDGRRPGMDNTTEKSEKMKRNLIDFIEDITIINLPEGKDPNDLGEEFLNYV